MKRPVPQKDAEIIRRICEDALGHEANSTLISRRIEELSSDGSYYIAVFEDDSTHDILGFIQAERYELLYGDRGWNIIALGVEPSRQRHGIGTELLRSLEKHAEQNGYTFVRLNCNVVREEAHAFYQSMGYLCDKTQKRFIKHFMEKENAK